MSSQHELRKYIVKNLLLQDWSRISAKYPKEALKKYVYPSDMEIVPTSREDAQFIVGLENYNRLNYYTLQSKYKAVGYKEFYNRNKILQKYVMHPVFTLKGIDFNKNTCIPVSSTGTTPKEAFDIKEIVYDVMHNQIILSNPEILKDWSGWKKL